MTCKRWSLLISLGALILPVSFVPVALAQPQHSDGKPEMQQGGLNLTQEQQATMQQIWQNQRSQMNSILTDEQKARLETARQNRTDLRQALESLNLTDEQKAKIQQLRAATRQQMDNLLTPEQRQQLQQRRPNRPSGSPPAQ